MKSTITSGRGSIVVLYSTRVRGARGREIASRISTIRQRDDELRKLTSGKTDLIDFFIGDENRFAGTRNQSVLEIHASLRSVGWMACSIAVSISS